MTIEKIFADLIATSICIDGVWYAPIEEIFSSIATIVVFYGLIFGAAMWLMQQIIDLLVVMFSCLSKKFDENLKKFGVTDE